MRAHGDRELYQYVYGVGCIQLRLKPEQRVEQVGAVLPGSGMRIDYLDLVTLQNCDIDKLAGIVELIKAAAVLDYEEPRRDDLENKTELRHKASCTPDQQIAIPAADAQVDSRALHCGPEPGERMRRERYGLFENDGLVDERRWDEREGNSGRIDFL